MFIGVVFVAAGLIAQAPVSQLSEGVKLLNYEKNKSALIFFKEALDKNPTDGETEFWYGQALLAQNYNGIPTTESIKKTKEVYQAAMQSKGNDPWLLIGMSHVQLLEGADNNAVKQKYDNLLIENVEYCVQPKVILAKNLLIVDGSPQLKGANLFVDNIFLFRCSASNFEVFDQKRSRIFLLQDFEVYPERYEGSGLTVIDYKKKILFSKYKK
jgi:hypothetical protein